MNEATAMGPIALIILGLAIPITVYFKMKKQDIHNQNKESEQ